MTYKYNPFTAAYPSDRGPLGKIFRPVLDYRTYFRAVHMFLMFPLGIAYFVFFVTTLAVGGAMIWTLVGPIVLLATLFISRWFGDLEAFIAGRVNGSPIRRPPFRLEGVSGFRSQVKVRLVDPTTWTGLIYLVVQFPIGIAAFTGLVVVYAAVGAATFAPVFTLITDNPIDIASDAGWTVTFNTPVDALLLTPVGLLGMVLASHLVLGFSSLHGWWAKLMLGSRSSRVSSRPAPTPAGDDPPRTTAVAETHEQESDSVADSGIVTEREIVADNDSRTDTESEPEIESPRTAARTSLTEEPVEHAEPFLKPVPNPSELVAVVEIVEPPLDLAPISELTAREQEVFMLMAHGDTNADIAEELFISEGTVKTHVKRVLSKLYMRDRTQVVVFAYERGLVVPGAVTGHEEIYSRRFGG